MGGNGSSMLLGPPECKRTLGNLNLDLRIILK
jgi:hypothetical protein